MEYDMQNDSFFDTDDEVNNFDEVEWEIIQEELKIDNSSPFSLQRELVEYPFKKNKYTRWRALAIEEVDKLTMQLEIVVSIIMDEICRKAEENGKPIASSGLSEVKKIKVPLDTRWRKIRKKLIKAVERANILEGLVFDWVSKGKRLEELSRLTEIYLRSDPATYAAGSKFSDRTDSVMESLEY